MKKLYINSVGSVSAQKTFDSSAFLEEVVTYDDTVIPVIDPDYQAYIPAAAARRMARGIKMSTVASTLALKEAGIEKVDSIMVGTGLGCISDSIKFVGDLIDNAEQYLTPTRFIQSSHNTVSGQIALAIGCTGHNFTYVHSSVSFESCLLDAIMQLKNDEASNILVGGVDEVADHHVNSHKLIDHIKKIPVATFDLLHSKTKGCVMSEGANFFVLSTQNKTSSYAELVSVQIYNTLKLERLPSIVSIFLEASGSSVEAIDLIIMGYNGDVDFDPYYDALASGMFRATPQVYYKHLSGEFDTASGFALWLGAKILREQKVPKAVMLNHIVVTAPKTVLLYNQSRGENHSLTLLRKC